MPEAQVDELVDLYPAECENCWAALPEVPDPNAKRYQTIEVPPIQPHTTEVRRHAVTCPCCGHKTRAAFVLMLVSETPIDVATSSLRGTKTLARSRLTTAP